MPTIVKAKRDESTDSVIKRFKKRMMIDNILMLLKDKEFYKKPSIKRKEHKKELSRRQYRERLERNRPLKTKLKVRIKPKTRSFRREQ